MTAEHLMHAQSVMVAWCNLRRVARQAKLTAPPAAAGAALAAESAAATFRALTGRHPSEVTLYELNVDNPAAWARAHAPKGSPIAKKRQGATA